MTGWRGWAVDCVEVTRDVFMSLTPYQWIMVCAAVSTGALVTVNWGKKGAQVFVALLLTAGFGAAMIRSDYQDSVIEIQRTKIAELSAVKEES